MPVEYLLYETWLWIVPILLFYRLKIENEDYKTTFIITKVKRADTGVYTVTAKNNSGTDQVDVEISVLSMFRKI